MPSPPADSGILRRRDVLLGFGRGAAGLVLLSVTAAACGSAPPEIDPLQAQLDLATADSDMARAATAAAAPPLVPALTQIAAERADHARALAVEIARAAGAPSPTTTVTTTTTTTATGTAAPPPSVKDVIATLRRSADGAAQLASTQSGYRAGLLGSISASCTASYAVGLNAPKAAS